MSALGIPLRVILDGEGAFAELCGDRQPDCGPATAVAALPGGMQSGLASVAILIELPDGRVVVGETSMRLFLAAARAFQARFGE